ncbi:alkylphosphonate utilization protein [Capnocytophaga sp.]|uniref:PhnA domain-containing protein n=1 Tax=Capnocytophaga sp. TaxID=44737 RepID=UPI0026DCAF93|nr:alkylphosphonate utilization protein [Capnocytophaga sp.]MDO5106168.1 PhnA domain-containing protein [Capnocytophaga sp.]
MNLLQELQKRSGNTCELCSATNDLAIYEVPPVGAGGLDGSLLACKTCISQIEGTTQPDSNHWRCLNDSMWSEHTPVKVVAWRMLNRLKNEGWSLDLLNMMYLDDEELAFAKASNDHLDESEKVIHRDSNGAVLQAGDNVVLIKDLKVKGSSMVAKQGTIVRKISLDRENAQYIEGKVDGQQIVIVTQYVKKV